MGRKRFTTEQIIHKLREAELLIAKWPAPERCTSVYVSPRSSAVQAGGRSVASGTSEAESASSRW